MCIFFFRRSGFYEGGENDSDEVTTIKRADRFDKGTYEGGEEISDDLAFIKIEQIVCLFGREQYWIRMDYQKMIFMI